MSEDQLHRRRFLTIAGAAGVAGLAGCTTAQPAGDQGSTTSDQTADQTETTEGGHDDEGQAEGDDHGHEDDSGHGGDLDGPMHAAEVQMTSTESGQHFEPHVVWVETGGTVTFHNESGAHSATAYAPANDKPQLVPDGAQSFDSGLLSEAGATFEHTFEMPGVYHYYCIPHESMGMIGSVIVGEPDPHDQPALQEPPADMPEAVREKLHSLNEQCNAALGHMH